MAIVAVAGPAANLIMAILYALPIRLGVVGFVTSPASGPLADIFPSLFQLLITGVSINLLLFTFNLLPIPPLDGFTILQGILPAELAYRIEPLRQYGTMILLAVLFLPALLGINILGSVISPIVGLFGSILLGSGF